MLLYLIGLVEDIKKYIPPELVLEFSYSFIENGEKKFVSYVFFDGVRYSFDRLKVVWSGKYTFEDVEQLKRDSKISVLTYDEVLSVMSTPEWAILEE